MPEGRCPAELSLWTRVCHRPTTLVASLRNKLFSRPALPLEYWLLSSGTSLSEAALPQSLPSPPGAPSRLEQGRTGQRAGAWAPPRPAGALPGPDHLRRADRGSDLLSVWVRPAFPQTPTPETSGGHRAPQSPRGNPLRPWLLRLWSSTPETCSSSDSGSIRLAGSWAESEEAALTLGALHAGQDSTSSWRHHTRSRTEQRAGRAAGCRPGPGSWEEHSGRAGRGEERWPQPVQPEGTTPPYWLRAPNGKTSIGGWITRGESRSRWTGPQIRVT